MKQRWLPEFDYPDVDAPESDLDTAGVADEESEATFAEVLPGQLGLLTAEREFVGQIQAAQAMLAPITNRLCAAAGSDERLPAEAAALLRDALLDGCEPAPGDFHDDRLVDLLAEDHSPVWLASLGALRQLWPVPPSASSELATFIVDSQDDDERGREFWACLRRTVSCGRDDPSAVAARKRMKQLDADMHALFMRDGVRRD